MVRLTFVGLLFVLPGGRPARVELSSEETVRYPYFHTVLRRLRANCSICSVNWRRWCGRIPILRNVSMNNTKSYFQAQLSNSTNISAILLSNSSSRRLRWRS
jgi:hypothetical protein